MADRVELQYILQALLGSNNVYYDPPESVKMEYPAIRYSKSKIKIDRADNIAYSMRKSYELIVISKKADHEVIGKLLALPYCSFERHYKADNLNHDVLTLYY